jgi:hypothetical protein
MSRLLCKACGNNNFQLLNESEALCKYCYRLTNISDYLSGKQKIRNEHFDLDQKWQALVITKVSLLKRAIDESLDKRDKKAFYKLTSILRVYQPFLQTRENRTPVTPKEGLRQPR